VAALLRVSAPAKINLCLEVLGQRADGYHEIRTIMQAVSLFDELSFSVRSDGRIVLHASGAGLPAPKDNLVVQAARLLKEECGCAKGADIELVKNIPVGGGLGGGSSDCAETLCALGDLWDLGLSSEHLAGLAARLGSDVPFFISGGTALCEGRGERVSALHAEGTFHYVLVMPPERISTGQAYAAVEGSLTTSRRAGRIEDVQAALATMDARRLGAALYNDLEVAAFRLNPRVRCVHQTFVLACPRVECLGLSLSGSGSSLFGVFDSHERARKAAVQLAGELEVPTLAVHSVPRRQEHCQRLPGSEDNRP